MGLGRDRRRASRWSRRALSRGAVGEYQLQAAIAAVHDEAATTEDTDWPQILALYSLLERTSGNPMVTLNRAVAAAMVHGPAIGLSSSTGWTPANSPATTGSTPSAATSTRWPGTPTPRPGLPGRCAPDDEPARAALPADPGAARLAHAGKAEAGRARAADAPPPAPPSKPEAQPGPGTREVPGPTAPTGS